MKNISVIESEPVFVVKEGYNIFNQLAVKVDMNHVDDKAYFEWLDDMIINLPQKIKGSRILEKEGVRENPPVNTAVYYDTDDYKLLPTGSLLRTSCSILTHAFCAFKLAEDKKGNRLDRRHVFEGIEKKTIQHRPYSDESIEIVRKLLTRTDIEQPGTFLKQEFNITSKQISPALVLFGSRSTFFVRIDEYDVLRCSIDRSDIADYRKDYECKNRKNFRECEISIYPRISQKISSDPRVIEMIKFLIQSLQERFNSEILYDIKYQRGAKLLGLY
jgi:hypothetical protein